MDYHSVYSWILLIFIFLAFIVLALNRSEEEEKLSSKVILILFCCVTVLFWGTRPSSVGVDTGNYVRRFMFIHEYSSIQEYLQSLDGDFFFGMIAYLLTQLGDINYYFTGIALFTMFGYYVFFSKLTQSHSQAILGMLMVACMFSFTGMLSNIIRNGLAIALFLPCTYYTFIKKYKLAVIWGIASLLSHESILLPLIGLLIVHFFNMPLRYYLYGYVVCSIMAMANLGVHSFGFIQDLGIIKLNNYINSDLTFYRTGFRIDFYAFNTFFLALFLILKKNSSIAFDRYLKLFIVMSSIFFLFFQIPFSDRFGIYSWVLIPVVLFLCTQSYIPEYRFTLSFVATIFLYFINELIYIYTTVPTPDS